MKLKWPADMTILPIKKTKLSCGFYIATTPTKATQTNSLQNDLQYFHVEMTKIVTRVSILQCGACLDRLHVGNLSLASVILICQFALNFVGWPWSEQLHYNTLSQDDLHRVLKRMCNIKTNKHKTKQLTYHLFNQIPLHKHIRIHSMNCVITRIRHNKLKTDWMKQNQLTLMFSTQFPL